MPARGPHPPAGDSLSRPLRVEEYLRFPEPHVDANGEETWTPLYHAKAAR